MNQGAVRQRIEEIQNAMITIRNKKKTISKQWDRQDLKGMQGHIDRLKETLPKINEKHC